VARSPHSRINPGTRRLEEDVVATNLQRGSFAALRYTVPQFLRELLKIGHVIPLLFEEILRLLRPGRDPEGELVTEELGHRRQEGPLLRGQAGRWLNDEEVRAPEQVELVSRSERGRSRNPGRASRPLPPVPESSPDRPLAARPACLLAGIFRSWIAFQARASFLAWMAAKFGRRLAIR
jgi:hypothetical protein